VRYTVDLDIDRDREHVRITTVTELERSWGQDVIHKRLAPLRESIAMERDDWSIRFSQVNPESERIILDRTRGELVRAEHSGVVNREDLARFFGDLPMTVTIARGNGWTELAIYPGSSSRASRQQREIVEQVLDVWTHQTANYFTRMSRLYEWMDAHPQMAEQAFTLLFDDNENAHATDEEEESLVTAARRAMSSVTEGLQRSEKDPMPVDELFDLVYNPFPAEITIRTPRAIVGSEHFEKRSDQQVMIRHAGLLDAAHTLEGMWLSPDPLAMLLKADEEKTEMATPEELAKMKRKWSLNVLASEVQSAILEAVKPAGQYRVRWSE
jgi:hypothetical protein